MKITRVSTKASSAPVLVPDLFKQALDAQLNNNFADAAALYQQILSIDPQHRHSLYNIGLMALQTGQMALSASMFQQAIDVAPSADAYSLLAMALINTNQDAAAILSCQHAIALDAKEYMAHKNLGILLCKQYRYEEGIEHFRQAIAINPNDFSALNDLALALMQQGLYQESATYFKSAIALNPNARVAYQNLLLCLCFDELAFPKKYLAEAARFDTLLTQNTEPYSQWPNATLSAAQALRIGFVSGDLNNHPVGFFLESVLTHIKPKKIELFCYDTAHHEDDLTLRIKPFIQQWLNVAEFNEAQIAQKIHEDGIHILIDLAGHTAHNKLSVFAYKPAPVQISWLGYFASTGVSFIDYFVADPISVPAKNLTHFSEIVWYLPKTRLCFSPPATNIAQEMTLLPALQNGFFTFGCFQGFAKVNDKMLMLWATILAACPNSKIMFKNHQIKDTLVKEKLLSRLHSLNIDNSRILLEEGGSRDNYFNAYGSVDFMLDTFPYPGGTTTCEALWMGVPTLTLAGNTLLERQGMAILTNAGLSEWVATNEQEYVQKAVYFATNLQKLAELRKGLRTQFQHSPMMDAKHFTPCFEDALLAMWQEKMG